VIGPIGKRLFPGRFARRGGPPAPPPTLPYSWILTGELALGPMPRSEPHWRQLEALGLNRRFSLCYPEEERITSVPEHWRSERFSLPDHRRQEPLLPERLEQGLSLGAALLEEAGAGPIYLHCLAGRERSPLMAVGLVARRRGLDLFEALDWVRRCHPAASPMMDHLEVLEQLLRR
jgi:hypothetical protein